jgi:serine/threonine protein phosphatase PrpC
METSKNYIEAFLTTDKRLNQSVETSLSGTTVSLVIFEGNKLITLNAGDSRAVKVSLVAEDDQNLRIEVKALTIDHKPDLPEEEERINKAGGRIAAFKDAGNGEDVGP